MFVSARAGPGAAAGDEPGGGARRRVVRRAVPGAAQGGQPQVPHADTAHPGLLHGRHLVQGRRGHQGMLSALTARCSSFRFCRENNKIVSLSKVSVKAGFLRQNLEKSMVTM